MAQGGNVQYNLNIAAQNPQEIDHLQMRLAQFQGQILESQPTFPYQALLVDTTSPTSRDVLQDGAGAGGSGGKYARYTVEQVDVLERLFIRCPKPTLKQRQQLLLDCPTLRGVDQNQIKVWFQNRRCREKQRKESSRLQVLNGQLSAMNSTLMDENTKLQQQIAQLLYENNVLRHHLNNSQYALAAYNYNNCNSNISSSGTSASLSPTPTPSPPSQRSEYVTL